MRKILSLLASVVMLAGGAGNTQYAFQDPAPGEPEARIPFVHLGGLYNWHADNDRLLYVEGRDRQWYRVNLFGPCIGLEFASGLRLIPSDSAGTFDRFGSIAIRDQRCKVESVKKVAQPVLTHRDT